MDYASHYESQGPTPIYIKFRAAKGGVAESIIHESLSPKAGCGVMIEDFF